jgi:hypothetical protein
MYQSDQAVNSHFNKFSDISTLHKYHIQELVVNLVVFKYKKSFSISKLCTLINISLFQSFTVHILNQVTDGKFKLLA